MATMTGTGTKGIGAGGDPREAGSPANDGAGPGGFALLWALLAVIGLSVIGAAAHAITSGDRVLSDNFEVEGKGLYAADAGLGEYYGIYAPLGVPDGEFVIDCDNSSGNSGNSGNSGGGNSGSGSSNSCNSNSGSGNSGSGEESTVDSVLWEFHGSDLETRNFGYLDSDVTITPLKLAASINGDVYLLSARAEVDDPRTRFPRTDRPLYSFAQLVPPVKFLGTVMSPNGFTGTQDGDDIKIEGKSKGKCGEGNLPALVTPQGTTVWDNKKTELKSEDPYQSDPHDEESDDFDALIERMGADWSVIGNAAAYQGKDNFVEVPGDYPDLEAVDFKQWDKKKDKWPIVFHHGTADLSDDEKVKGHGLLVVEDSLIVGKEKLDWKGLIIVGRISHFLPDPNEGHMHLKGGLMTGLACTQAEVDAGDCTNLFEGKHLDIKFHSCEVDAAWTQLLSLRPRGRTRWTPRHTGVPGVKVDG